jgi:hypothetical protein
VSTSRWIALIEIDEYTVVCDAPDCGRLWPEGHPRPRSEAEAIAGAKKAGWVEVFNRETQLDDHFCPEHAP